MAHYTMPHLEVVGEGSLSEVSLLDLSWKAAALIIRSVHTTKHVRSSTRHLR